MAEDTVAAGRLGDEQDAGPAEIHELADLTPKTRVKGTVKRLELYGAFIDLGFEPNAILHISRLGESVNRISDVLKVGDEVDVWVESVDPGRRQITVTMIEPAAVEWNDLAEGQIYTGTVTRLEPFGAFVNIGAERDGLVHVSELSNEYVRHPSERVSVGDELQVKVMGFNRRKRRIDLSHKATLDAPRSAQPTLPEESYLEDEEEDEVPTAMELALRQAMQQSDRTEKSGGSTRRGQGRKARQKQEDILSRTLRMNEERD
jgi:ribosomal protein S1